MIKNKKILILTFLFLFCLCFPCKGYARGNNESWDTACYAENYSDIPYDYQNLVQKADIYVNRCYYSKEAATFMLKEVEHYSDAEIQYAFSKIDTDWNKSALYTAKMLQEQLKYSDSKIEDALGDEYWGVFTKSEIAYAMSHLDTARSTVCPYTPHPERSDPMYSNYKDYKKAVEKWEIIREQEIKTYNENQQWWYELKCNDN